MVAALPRRGSGPHQAPSSSRRRPGTHGGLLDPLHLDRDDAERVSELALRLSARVNETIVWVRDQGREAEFVTYRRLAGRILGYLFTELLDPLWRQPPNLEPPEMGASSGQKTET